MTGQDAANRKPSLAALEVLTTGPLCTVQDAGRDGWAALGVPRSGAFDRTALRAANRLVGNPPDAAALELTLGGLTIRALRAMTVALSGAACPGLDPGTPVSLTAGAVLRLGAPAAGLRSYLAIRGGIAVDPVLGSRSTDTLSGLGPAPLRTGDLLPVGRPPTDPVLGAALASGPQLSALRVVPGPRDDWFAVDAIAQLRATPWLVQADSDRVGVRLDGAPLPRTRAGELVSEPTLPGALQIPPDGRPILLGPDAPVTGGYPVIGVVHSADLDHAAQLRPGDTVRFR